MLYFQGNDDEMERKLARLQAELDSAVSRGVINKPHLEKLDVCLCENKGAVTACADQRLCFCHMDSTIPPLLIPKISRF